MRISLGTGIVVVAVAFAAMELFPRNIGGPVREVETAADLKAQGVIVWSVLVEAGWSHSNSQVLKESLEGLVGYSTDAWGQHVKCLIAKEVITLTSAGADRVWGTSDDIVVVIGKR